MSGYRCVVRLKLGQAMYTYTFLVYSHDIIGSLELMYQELKGKEQ